jgi:integrase
MSVRKRKWVDAKGSSRASWVVHVKHKHPDGSVQNIRKTSPVQTRRGAEQYEREIRRALAEGSLRTRPRDSAQLTLAEFIPVFLQEHGVAGGLRPRYIRAQQIELTNHAAPVIGNVRVAELGSKHFGLVKRAMLGADAYSPKTVNNVLGTLACLVRFWYEREGLDAPAFKAGLLKQDEVEPHVCSPGAYARMIEAAADIGPEALALLLLMGDAGLRQGEVRGLKIGDIVLEKPASIRVQRAMSIDGDEHSPKGRRNRTVPMTARLREALAEHVLGRPAFGLTWVLARDDGSPLTTSCVQVRLASIEAVAGIEGTGRSHHLRHLFVTELAAANVPARVIQELAGHRDLKTTLRYMHLQEGQAHAAISELERRQAGAHTEHTEIASLHGRGPTRKKRASGLRRGRA